MWLRSFGKENGLLMSCCLPLWLDGRAAKEYRLKPLNFTEDGSLNPDRLQARGRWRLR